MLRALLILLGVLGIADTLVVSAYSNLNFGTVLPLIIGLPLLLIGLFFRPVTAFFSSTALGAWVKGLLIAAYAGFFALVAICSGLIYREGHATPPAGADAVIVLGCAVRGERVSLTLARRLDAALAYLEQNPEACVVVSGGQGAGEHISEAEAMRRYLTARGIAESRILLEDKSMSTLENFRFSKALIDEAIGPDAKLVFVTTRFHVFRSERIARSLGIAAEGFGADDVVWLSPNNYLRETCAIVYYWLSGRI